jgi:AcrR family transcriptional regulator
MPRPRTVDDATILAAAAEAIGETGPSELTLAAIAAKVGLAPPTLVQRFGSKRGLLLAVAARGADGVPDRFREARARHRSHMNALAGALRSMAAPVSTPDAMANNLAFLQLDLRDPEFHRFALAHSRKLRDEIRALLEDAVAAREIEPCDTRRLAEAVEAVYNGAMITWSVQRHGSLDRWLTRQLETVLAAQAPPRG